MGGRVDLGEQCMQIYWGSFTLGHRYDLGMANPVYFCEG